MSQVTVHLDPSFGTYQDQVQNFQLQMQELFKNANNDAYGQQFFTANSASAMSDV